MTKTLYLDRSSATIRLDGPSLEVRSDGSAPLRYPLARVSRIIVGAGVRLEGAALAACLKQGIPVAFLEPRDTAIGFAIPAHSRRSGANEALENFLARTGWEAQFENWRRSAERRECLAALKRLGIWASDLHPAAVRRDIEQAMGRSAPLGRVRTLMDEISALGAVAAVAAIRDSGFDASLAAERRPGFNLPETLRSLLAWRLYAHLGQCLADPAGSGLLAPGWRAALVSAFENVRGQTEARARKLLDAFHYWIRGLR